MSKITKFKEGAASFYIVAISTLILVIIAASFAAVIISEVTRTSNDDLSQSAYDSALAGVEDAKLTYYNYQKCKDGGAEGNTQIGYSNFTCSELIAWIEDGVLPNGQDECDVVANALARNIETDENGEKLGVLVQEGNTSGGSTNDMEQYYTCVKIAAQTQDVLGVLNDNDQEHSVRIRFRDADAINKVAKVRLSWHSPTATDDGDRGFDYMESELNNTNTGIFGKESVKPAVVALTMVQTATNFSLGDFTTSNGAATDRGTLYFVPSPASGSKLTSSTDYYTLADTAYINGGVVNTIRNSASEGFAKSNNKDIKNTPYVVRCNTGSQDYACITESEIPAPVNGSRSDNTFIFSVSLPYGGPKTHYQLEFLDAQGNVLVLDGVQISVDSTGRANDLFRRVETRLEPADAAYPYPIFGIQALDPNSNPAIWKNFYSTCEYHFDDITC